MIDLMRLSLPFGLEYVLNFILLFLIYKVLFILGPRINQTITWILEYYYRRRIYLRAIDLPIEMSNRWYLNDILFLFLIIAASQQALAMYTHMNMIRWNSIINQITEFHQKNPLIPKPQLSSQSLKGILSFKKHLIDYLIITVGVPGSLWVCDRKLVNCLRSPAGFGTQFLQLIPIVVAAYSTLMYLSIFVTKATLGQSELELVLNITETKVNTFEDIDFSKFLFLFK